MFQQLTIRFETREGFSEEFETNIARGGIFIPTVDTFAMREVVDVEIDLAFCGELCSAQAEVVSQLGAKLNTAGGVAGVAVQFLEPSETLRHRLAELTGMPDVEPSTLAGDNRRRHRRATARVATEVMSANGPIKAKAKDISSSGVLVSIEGMPVPLGETVELKIVHPSTGKDVVVNGKVARYVERDHGMTDMAVEFEDPDDTETNAKLGDLRSAAHAHRLGGINGSVEALGVPNLLQMFPTSAPEGTLILSGIEGEGRLLFENGGLRHVRFGPVEGPKALARLLGWTEGEFEFHPSILPGEPEGTCIPMDAVMLDALTKIDELGVLDIAALPREARLGVGKKTAEELEKLETAVVDWVALGTTVGELLDALPQFDSEIYSALLSLIDQGLVENLR